MTKNIDELINDYVDGNLDNGEIEELNKLLSQNPSAVVRLKAHKVVDAHLRDMNPEPAPENITAKVMSQINSLITKELPKSYFLQGVLGFFSISLISLLVIFFSYFSTEDKEYLNGEIAINKFNVIINDIVGKVTGQLVGTDLMLIISIVSLIVMLSLYFLYETNKTFKKRLHNTAR